MNYRKSVVDFINTYEEIEQKQQLTRQEMQVREESRQLATDIMKCTAFIENSCGLVMSEVSNQLIKETLNKCNDMIFEYDKIAIQHNKINSELDQMPILQPITNNVVMKELVNKTYYLMLDIDTMVKLYQELTCGNEIIKNRLYAMSNKDAVTLNGGHNVAFMSINDKHNLMYTYSEDKTKSMTVSDLAFAIEKTVNVMNYLCDKNNQQHLDFDSLSPDEIGKSTIELMNASFREDKKTNEIVNNLYSSREIDNYKKDGTDKHEGKIVISNDGYVMNTSEQTADVVTEISGQIQNGNEAVNAATLSTTSDLSKAGGSVKYVNDINNSSSAVARASAGFATDNEIESLAAGDSSYEGQTDAGVAKMFSGNLSADNDFDDMDIDVDENSIESNTAGYDFDYESDTEIDNDEVSGGRSDFDDFNDIDFDLDDL